jgi:hypothetical protein
MAGIDFDRQAFVPSTATTTPSQTPRIVGRLFMAIAVLVAVFLGFKLVSKYLFGETRAETTPQSMEQIQQQLAAMEKRIDQLEKHRRPVTVERQPSQPPAPVSSPAAAPVPKRSTYKIEAASAWPTQRTPSQKPPNSGLSAEISANREAWQATSDRLADVVGVVGTQQGQISQTREDLNLLLAETRRTAVPFELRRGGNRESVGPLSLLLKNSDPKTQRYTLCIYVGDQCAEIKDRAADEVVVIVLSRYSAPLELVATKVLKDQIVGYLEVPSDKPIR